MQNGGKQYDEIIKLLKDSGALLVRSKKHQIWGWQDGRRFTIASSPSCAHAYKNCLEELKRFLGIKQVGEFKEGERREKKVKSETGKEKPTKISEARYAGTFEGQLLGALMEAGLRLGKSENE